MEHKNNSYMQRKKKKRKKGGRGTCLPEKKRKARVRQRSAWVSICFDNDFYLN
jgi:hypothetical protein